MLSELTSARNKKKNPSSLTINNKKDKINKFFPKWKDKARQSLHARKIFVCVL